MVGAVKHICGTTAFLIDVQKNLLKKANRKGKAIPVTCSGGP
jgi:hypothetical protein